MRARADRGAVSVFVALSVVGLVFVVVMVLDACRRLNSIEATDAVAQETARAVGQQLDQEALLDGQYRIDHEVSIAQKAADDYLQVADGDLSCKVTFVNDSTVSVTVKRNYYPLLLGGNFPVYGTGSATLVHGVTKPENG